jgi:hypothetical protein
MIRSLPTDRLPVVVAVLLLALLPILPVKGARSGH